MSTAKEFFDQSIRAKLIATMTGGVLMIVGVLTYVIAQNAANSWEEAAHNQLQSQLDQSVTDLSNFLKEREHHVKLWASQLLDAGNEAYPGLSMTLYFSDVKNKEPWIDQIFLITPNNLIYDSSGTLEWSQEASPALSELLTFLKEPVSDFLPYTMVTASKPDQELLLLTRPLFKQGKPLPDHQLAVLLDLSRINQHLFGDKRIGKNGFLTLVAQHESGSLFWPQLNQALPSQAELAQGFSQWPMASEIPEEYQSLLIAQRRVPGFSMLMVGVLSVQDIREPILGILQTSLIWGLIFSVIGILGALFIEERITAPIRKLTETVESVAEMTASNPLSELPQKSVPLLEARNDEIGTLNAAFDQLREALFQRDAKISEQILALSELNEELKVADRLKDEFLANVSHELRTPLHGIIGITESLMDHPEAPVSQEHLDNLAIIRSSSRRLNHLVNDILDSSMLHHKRLKLNTKAVDMHGVAQMVLGLFRYLVGSKTLQLINAVPLGLPPVEVDENRIQQVMHNLVENAIKFTDRGFIRISAQVQEEVLEVCVEDTGIGIALEKFEAIFEFFIQADGSISRKYGGTGLGLAISKRLIELHHGQIRVESEEGHGAKFLFTLPLSKQNTDSHPVLSQVIDYVPEPPTPTESSVSSSLQPTDSKRDPTSNCYRLLLVDDDPVNLQVLHHYLNATHYSLQQAMNGLEALEVIDQQGKPDLILLDVMMPKMSGFELCARIRNTFPPHELPIIFLTAKNQVADLVEGFSLGANDYVAKPFSKQELLARVENQIFLLHAKEQMVSLRHFSNRISQFEEVSQIIENGFREIYEHVDADTALLFCEDQLHQTHPPTAEIRLENHLEIKEFPEGVEVNVSNVIAETESAALAGCHCVWIRVAGLENYRMVLIRRVGRPIFSSTDVEYIQHIIEQIKIIRKNLQTIVANDNFLPAINQIKVVMKQILYVQAQSPYCQVVLDTKTQEGMEFRLTLQNLVTYFGETFLLQVHRSYLVNPQKLVSVQRKHSSAYEALLKTTHNEIVSIPVGRAHYEKVRSLCANQ